MTKVLHKHEVKNREQLYKLGLAFSELSLKHQLNYLS